MLHFVLMLHALEIHCKKKKKRKHEHHRRFLFPQTYSHLQVALQDLTFYIFTTPTCIKGCGSIFDQLTHPPSMFMVWQRQGFGQWEPSMGQGQVQSPPTGGLSRGTAAPEGDKEPGSTPTCFAAVFILPYRQSSCWNLRQNTVQYFK